jgi:hypothetical protein
VPEVIVSFATAPIPLSVTVCGLPAALSVTLRAAVRVPLAVGLNVTLMLQLAPVANELPQVWVCAKSPALVPVIAIPLIVKLVVPTLLSVTVSAGLDVPRATVPKLRLVGESFAVVPIPIRLTFCGLPAALSVTLRAAVRVPLAVGLNVILMLQLAPVANELPQVWVCAKSPALVPVIAIPLIVKVVVPILVSVTGFAGLDVPRATVPKLRLVGESFAVVPIPVRPTFCGLPAALSVTLRAAVRVPLAVGLNVTLMLQLVPAANEVAQL